MPVVLALVSALARLVWLRAPLTPDESGFLQVARSWRPGAGSLYGPYFVDRPPLLLEIFRLCGLAGGIPAVRLLGAAAAGVTVLCVGVATRRSVGDRAAVWASLTAAALMASPMMGTTVPNGELFAAPFVAAGVLAVVTHFGSEGLGRRVWSGLAVGACAAAAVLVKQNMVDVAVFAAAAAAVMVLRGVARRYDLVVSALSAVAGAVVVCLPVLGFAVARGSTLHGILYAMYPFRVDAATVMAHAGQADRSARLSDLVLSALLSGVPVVLVVMTAGFAARALRPRTVHVDAVAAGVLAVAAYDIASVAAGGSYWLHYLVQLIVPTSVAVGLLVASRWRSVLIALPVVIALVAVAAWSSILSTRIPADGQVIGQALAGVSNSGDSVVSLYGDADVVQASGLGSPYPYLWSLPAHTLDPHAAVLDLELSGPSAPTWVVVRGAQTRAFLDSVGAGAILAERYHPAAEVCGRSIYLRDGTSRLPPQPPTRTAARYHACRLPLVPWLHPGASPS